MGRFILMRAAAACALATAILPCHAAYQDPLDVPARQSTLVARSAMAGIATSGSKVAAVGRRGHILIANDAGTTWIQSPSPVSSDLVAVHFASERHGWAVGHDGVVLHSGDGGRSWAKQFDGRAAAKTTVAYYREAGSGQAGSDALLADAQRYIEQGPIHPFLDVWFEDEQKGFVVGAFGQIFATEDGGNSWIPWMDRMDNPNSLHLYGIRGSADGIYVVGEQGLILRLDKEKRRFVALPGSYQGTYFGLVAEQGTLLVFGMRGNAFRSSDSGRTWNKVDTRLSEGITGGTRLADGRIVLVTQGSKLLISNDGGASFTLRKAAVPNAFAGVAAAGTGVAVVGAQGVGFEKLK
ncbi:WD40/YVTN/BNR-like repeat-containing protein [Massilia cavernae]|uniref:Glycosyl hydrolase n=1 Tax=Massilia cavernae TaxID=2320864 RepID=A0A418XPZ0_9BURK|nr:YCF48-related protein [Massilia cavernae]RJG14491.1 glycosyl hydrolase [Massilia cavernae]